MRVLVIVSSNWPSPFRLAPGCAFSLLSGNRSIPELERKVGLHCNFSFQTGNGSSPVDTAQKGPEGKSRELCETGRGFKWREPSGSAEGRNLFKPQTVLLRPGPRRRTKTNPGCMPGPTRLRPESIQRGCSVGGRSEASCVMVCRLSADSVGPSKASCLLVCCLSVDEAGGTRVVLGEPGFASRE